MLFKKTQKLIFSNCYVEQRQLNLFIHYSNSRREKKDNFCSSWVSILYSSKVDFTDWLSSKELTELSTMNCRSTFESLIFSSLTAGAFRARYAPRQLSELITIDFRATKVLSTVVVDIPVNLSFQSYQNPVNSFRADSNVSYRATKHLCFLSTIKVDNVVFRVT